MKYLELIKNPNRFFNSLIEKDQSFNVTLATMIIYPIAIILFTIIINYELSQQFWSAAKHNFLSFRSIRQLFMFFSFFIGLVFISAWFPIRVFAGVKARATEIVGFVLVPRILCICLTILLLLFLPSNLLSHEVIIISGNNLLVSSILIWFTYCLSSIWMIVIVMNAIKAFNSIRTKITTSMFAIIFFGSEVMFHLL